MTEEIIPITSRTAVITVNCYLVKTGAGFFLIDCGLARARTGLVKALESAGCRPGDLNLVILTHGDLDHSGNAACFAATYWKTLKSQP